MGFLRFLLAVSIVVFHCGPLWKFKFITGYIAVETFFVISGFYMSLILNEKYIGSNSSYKLFVTNRLLRLYPIYWTVLILTCLFSLVIFKLSNGASFPVFSLFKYTNPGSATFLIFANLGILGQDIVSFLGIEPETGNLFFTENFWITRPQLNMFLLIPQAWTVSLELMFYAVAPFILRKKTGLIIGLLFLSVLFRFFLYNKLRLRFDPWTFRFFPTEIAFFLAGYLSYRLYVKFSNFPPRKHIAWASLVWIAMLTLLYGYLPVVTFSVMPFSLNELVYFLSVIFSIPALFSYFRTSKIDATLGNLSYPIYVSHYLVVGVLASLGAEIFRQTWCIIAVTVVSSGFLNILIGNRIELIRQKRLTTS